MKKAMVASFFSALMLSGCSSLMGDTAQKTPEELLGEMMAVSYHVTNPAEDLEKLKAAQAATGLNEVALHSHVTDEDIKYIIAMQANGNIGGKAYAEVVKNNEKNANELEKLAEGTGLEINRDGYKRSNIVELEIARSAIDELYNTSLDIYTDYVAKLANDDAAGRVNAALSFAQNEEERNTVLADIKANSPADYDAYVAFVNSDFSKKISIRVVKAAAKIAVQSAAFAQVDTAAMLKTVDFQDLMDEKDNLALTQEQLDLMTEAIGSLNAEYEANKAANLLTY